MLPCAALESTVPESILFCPRCHSELALTDAQRSFVDQALRRRKLADVTWELKRQNVISEGWELLPIDKDDRVSLPSNCDYQSLSVGSLKGLGQGATRFSNGISNQ